MSKLRRAERDALPVSASAHVEGCSNSTAASRDVESAAGPAPGALRRRAAGGRGADDHGGRAAVDPQGPLRLDAAAAGELDRQRISARLHRHDAARRPRGGSLRAAARCSCWRSPRSRSARCSRVRHSRSTSSSSRDCSRASAAERSSRSRRPVPASSTRATRAHVRSGWWAPARSSAWHSARSSAPPCSRRWTSRPRSRPPGIRSRSPPSCSFRRGAGSSTSSRRWRSSRSSSCGRRHPIGRRSIPRVDSTHSARAFSPPPSASGCSRSRPSASHRPISPSRASRSILGPPLYAVLTLGAGALAIRHFRRTPDPFIDLRAFRNRVFSSAVIVSLLTGYGLATAIIGSAVFIDRVRYAGAGRAAGGPRRARVRDGGRRAGVGLHPALHRRRLARVDRAARRRGGPRLDGHAHAGDADHHADRRSRPLRCWDSD